MRDQLASSDLRISSQVINGRSKFCGRDGMECWHKACHYDACPKFRGHLEEYAFCDTDEDTFDQSAAEVDHILDRRAGMRNCSHPGVMGLGELKGKDRYYTRFRGRTDSMGV